MPPRAGRRESPPGDRSVFVERSEDPNRERELATTLDELDQRVEVDPLVARDPGGDLARDAPVAAGPASEAAADVVVDLPRGDELLEAGERDRVVAAAEAADRHHGLAGRELDRRRRVRRVGRGDPGVTGR